MKVATILGTRPEIIRLSRVLAALDEHTDHVLIHTGQNYDYELNDIFFQELEIRKPDHFLDAARENAAQTIGQVIQTSDTVLRKESPDAVLILGDTNSCMAAIAAKKLKIPVFHMEAGNRCFDERVPEELNRRVIDHVSDINLAYTEHARRHLLAEGIRPETIVVTGSPMREVLQYYQNRCNESQVMSRLDLRPSRYVMVSVHRVENVDDENHFDAILSTLNAIAETLRLPVLVSLHPRTKKRLEGQKKKTAMSPSIRFVKPLGFLDYIKLQQNAYCVVSDSGTITEESAILGFPAVTIRQAHERPEGMDHGVLVMCGLQGEQVLAAIQTVCHQHEKQPANRRVPDYEPEYVSQTVLRVILGYTDFVNRRTWFKL